MEKNRKAANCAGLLAWRELRSIFCEDRCGAFPRGRRAKGRLAAVAYALTESALQSRGGDGLQLGGSEEIGTSNSSATAERLPVFPSTKFAVNVICSGWPQG